MARLTRRGFTAGALAIVSGACGGVTREPYQDPPGGPVEPGPGDLPPNGPGGVAPPPDPGLPFGPVTRDGGPPAAIWSWTTPEQAAEIRRDGILFTRESSPTLGRGFLFSVLDERAANGDAAAARLAGTELAKGRFGWHNPWATVLGAVPGEAYGLELLRIEMRADTWFARLRASRAEIDFVDTAGQPVPTATVLASFERVGGILFENDIPRPGCAYGTIDVGGGGLVYREIYVGNEARLATFSHRTAAALAEVESAIAELGTFHDYLLASGHVNLAQGECSFGGPAIWSRGELGGSTNRYLASLAFASPTYAPDATTIAAIIAELERARFIPDPYIHTA